MNNEKFMKFKKSKEISIFNSNDNLKKTENLQKDYKDPKVKKELLSNEEDINNGTTSKEDGLESLLTPQFIDDLDKAIDLTSKDPVDSPTVNKLLLNEMNLLNKIKEKLDENNDKKDKKHEHLIDDAKKIFIPRRTICFI